MTTVWKPSGEWAGATVAVLGNGPTLAADMAALPPGCKIIAANRAIAACPKADMMVAIDANEPPAGFTGLYVVGHPSDGKGLFPGISYESVEIAAGNWREFRNNAMLAIRLAVGMGATSIELAGFDTARYEQIHSFPGLTLALEQLMADLRGRGIAIDFVQTSAPAA